MQSVRRLLKLPQQVVALHVKPLMYNMPPFQQNSDISQREAVTEAAMLVSVGTCESVMLFTPALQRNSQKRCTSASWAKTKKNRKKRRNTQKRVATAAA